MAVLGFDMRAFRLAFVIGVAALWGVLAVPASAVAQPPSPPSLKPPKPANPWVTESDAAILTSVFDAIDKRKYSLANQLRQTPSAPIARSLADWAYLRSSAKDVTPAAIDRFLDRNYGWPNSELLQRKAEEEFDYNTPISEILSFFDDRDPITGDGRLQLARALLASGNDVAGIAQLRRAWIDHNWSSREEKEILSGYGAYLNSADHWAKADRQLFDIDATITRRLLPYLDADRRAEAEARIALLRADRGATTKYANLPNSSAQDSGVLHAMTRYHRRRGNEPEAVLYASLAPLDRDELRNPERWFYERKLLARWALKTGRFDDAYTLSAYSGLEGGADFAEAEFMAGWVALRFLNDPERAKAHFAFLGTGVTAPISVARGEYWLGRAWAAAGDLRTADQHYRVAAAYPFTFYGQLAIEALGDQAPEIPFPDDLEPDANALTIFEARPLVHAMHILAEVEEPLHFDRFARALDDQIELKGEVSAYYDLVMAERKTYLAVRGAKVARNNGAEVPSIVYPVVYVPETAKRYAEEALILGLSRQESEFNPRAYSSARAKGMMQLIDSTARLTARKEGLPYSSRRLLDDPEYNLTLGAAHLSHLFERFRGSHIMVLAAYNAGPHRVDQWVKAYGDPRTPEVDPIDWIELIPFSETRNYVMRVLENTQAYRARLNGIPLGHQAEEDLLSGGNHMAAIGKEIPAPQLLMVSLDDGGGPNIMNRPKRRPLALERYDLRFPPLHPETTNRSGE